MEITVRTGRISDYKADAIIVNIFEGTESLDGAVADIDKALDGAISQLISQGEIKGKLGENTLVHSLGKLPAARVVVAGLGKETDLDRDKVRGVVGETCRLLRGKGVKSIATVAQGAGSAGIDYEGAGQTVTEGATLGLYRFRKYFTKENENGDIEQLTIIDSDEANTSALEAGCRKGEIIAGAALLARDLTNEPSNYMTPTDMAREASRVAETYGLNIEVLDKEQMEEMGMGALLGVARGSHQPPKFIILRYRGRESGDWDIALAGKAITFDSGGISLKPSSGMGDMKGDMAGGASVIAAMTAIAQLKPVINVLALVPATENLPGGNALKPADILTAIDGKTIEIISTDAEGRLILADALGYARKQEARRIVDIATLTGACVVALGTVCTGVFGNNQELIDSVISAGTEAGEKMWHLPTFDEYKEQNKSDVADIKNTGGRDAGASTAALFIGEFAGDTPWVHMDIAGTERTEKQKNYYTKGATGIPVRTLINLVLSLAD